MVELSIDDNFRFNNLVQETLKLISNYGCVNITNTITGAIYVAIIRYRRNDNDPNWQFAWYCGKAGNVCAQQMRNTPNNNQTIFTRWNRHTGVQLVDEMIRFTGPENCFVFAVDFYSEDSSNRFRTGQKDSLEIVWKNIFNENPVFKLYPCLNRL